MLGAQIWGVRTETDPKPWGEVGRIMGMQIWGGGMGTEAEIWGEQRGHRYRGWGHGIEGGGEPTVGGGGVRRAPAFGAAVWGGGT